MVNKTFLFLLVAFLFIFPCFAEGWEFQKPPLGVEVDWSNPITEGLVGCWLFNEGGGDKVYDLSGNGNTGTLTNMAFPSTTTSGWNPGKDGSALAFGGLIDVIHCGTNPTLDFVGKNITVIARIYPTISDATARYIFAKGSSYYVGFFIQDYGGIERIAFGINGSTPLTRRSNSSAITLNTYQDVAVTHNGSIIAANSHIYVDGIEVTYADTINGSNLLDDTGQVFYIGNRGDLARDFVKRIDFLFFFNRIFSLQEIQQFHINPYGMFKRMEVSLIKSLAVAGWSHKWNGLSGINWNGIPNANISKINGL